MLLYINHFWRGTVYQHVFVCLFATMLLDCEQDKSKSYGLIFAKFSEQVEYGTEKSWLNFGRLGLGFGLC